MDQRFSKFETLCAQDPKVSKTTEAHKSPIYANSTFKFNTVEEGVDIFLNQPGQHVYTRYGNPGIEAVAHKIAQLETCGSELNAFGQLTSSGMAALHLSIMALVKSGDRIITQGNLYGGTTELLYKIFQAQGVDIITGDVGDELFFEKQISQKWPGNTIVLLETPANPTLQCLDISDICTKSKANNAQVIVDNTFATPLLQQPLLLGADLVIHSTTKYLHGHGLSTGGVIIGIDHSLIRSKIWECMKLVGSNSNPFDAWLINIGLKTLVLRMQKQCSTAHELAYLIIQHPKIKTVFYPGLESHPSHSIAKKQMNAFGAMISFEVGETLEDAMQFCNKLKLCSIAPSLGETDTMVLHPATMSHLKVAPEIRAHYGITDNLIRMSIGLERTEDIFEDICSALK